MMSASSTDSTKVARMFVAYELATKFHPNDFQELLERYETSYNLVAACDFRESVDAHNLNEERKTKKE